MVKHAQTIRRQKPMNCLSVFDHFVVLALKGLTVGKMQAFVILLKNIYGYTAVVTPVLRLSPNKQI